MLQAFVAAGLAAAAVLGFAAQAQAAPSVFTPGPCAGDFTGVAHKVDCGVLAVDESRGQAGARRVALPVAIVRALAPKAGLPPVIYLHGGPGGGVLSGLPRTLRSPAAREMIAIDQDWIYFDQRGAGVSAPSLDCGRVDLTDAGPLSQAAADSLVACAQRHVAAGVDLSRYNAAEVARDVADLRRALGIGAFDLVGGSYGVRIEFAILTHAVEGVRAVVMDSPWSPEAKWADGGPKMVADAVRLILAKCQADAACRAKHPTLEADFAALARGWLAKPFVKAGRTYAADDLGGFLMEAAYSAEGARALPRDLAKIIRGDMSLLDASIAERSGYAEAQHLTHLCKEEFPFEDRAAVAAGAAGDPIAGLLVASMQRYFDVCRAYPVGPADPLEQRPVTSSIPALFLAAEIDPGCPPHIAEAAAKRFSRGQFVVIPNTTHGVSGRSACARRMVRAFLANPAAPVDRACLSPEHDRFVFDLEDG
ncbi:alpha/beta hydrolase [Phenylobacterium sp.]|uniref:alpha/beta hydrolase n=1 Tax=Phenylobacterium sp. TaxID=1871053 RepID=UPI0039838310